jgi:four helix bundle protein
MNIAEGCGRGSDLEFGRFLHITMGSVCELEYQLILAHDLRYLDLDEYDDLSRDTTRSSACSRRLSGS